MEIILVSATPNLADTLTEQYVDIVAHHFASFDLAETVVLSQRPPQAVYVEDAFGSLQHLWSIIHKARERTIPVLVGLHSIGRGVSSEFIDAGVPTTLARGPQEIAAWIGQTLGTARRTGAKGQKLLTVAGAKGGIGKTNLLSLMAEGFTRRGIKVLVWDCDVANPGIVPAFRIPPGAPSYLSLAREGAGAWAPSNVRRTIYPHESGIDFLIGSELTTHTTDGMNDILWPDWQKLLASVRELDEYQVVLVDTGPDYLKRPYAAHILSSGGYVILPAPPGRKERTGVGNLLDHLCHHAPEAMRNCFLIFSEPERGVKVTIKDILPLFAQRYPDARVLGRIPRDPKVVSAADEQERYISPFDLAPTSALSVTMHEMVQSLCEQIKLTPPLPMPRVPMRNRLLGRYIGVPTSGTTLATAAREELFAA